MDKPRTDRQLIACNFTEGAKISPRGGMAYVINLNSGNGSENIELRARTRNGHWISKWEPLHRLCNFRLKTIPPRHPRYDDKECELGFTEAEYVAAEHLVWMDERAAQWRLHRAAKHERNFWVCPLCKKKEKESK